MNNNSCLSFDEKKSNVSNCLKKIAEENMSTSRLKESFSKSIVPSTTIEDRKSSNSNNNFYLNSNGNLKIKQNENNNNIVRTNSAKNFIDENTNFIV